MASPAPVGSLASSSTHPFRSTVLAAVFGTLVGVAGLGLLTSAFSAGGRAGGGDGWLQPAVRTAEVASDGLLYEASHGAVTAANKSEDPATAAMRKALEESHLKSMPPLPVDDLFDHHPGFFTVHSGKGLASGKVLLEVPKKMMDTPFLILGMVTSGNAVYAMMGHPSQTVSKTVFAFRKSDGLHDSLDLYRPLMDIRNEKVNSSMTASLRDGYFPGWVRSFSVRSFRNSYLLDASPWVDDGMNIFTSNDGRTSGVWQQWTRLVKATAFPRNVELDVQMQRRNVESLGENMLIPENTFARAVRYSILALPDKPMETRPADTRVGYFGTSFISADDTDGGSLKRTLINRWNLDNGPITFYIDPSVPVEWRPSIKRGVEEWEKAFARAGHPGAIRAVLPGGKDWPADYELGDARFSVIAWSPRLGPAYAMGPSEPDPRTGEILRGTIMMASNFVQYVAAEVHEGISDVAKMGFDGSKLPEMVERLESQVRARSFRMLGVLAAAEADEVAEVSRPAVATWKDSHIGRKMAVMGAPAAGVMTAVLEQTMVDLTMHEVGHVLGLRHNFRASSSTPYEQLSNRTWIEANGASTSVMDYLPLIVRENPADQVVYASPTIGAYDYAAIQYGYGAFESDDARLDFAQKVSKVTPFATDNDDAGVFGSDPLTNYFDLGGSPLEYINETLAVSRKVMRLSKASTMKNAGSQWLDFGDVAIDALFSAAFSLADATKFIGGRVPSRSSSAGSLSAPVKLVDVATEKRALSLLLRELNPRTGLFGSGTLKEYGAYMLSRRCFGSFWDPSEQCLGVQAVPLSSYLSLFRGMFLFLMTDRSKMGKLIEAAVMDGSRPGLRVTEMLRAITATFFDGTSAVDDLEREAQAYWVNAMIRYHDGKRYQYLPIAAAAVSAELSRIHAMVNTNAKDPHLRGLAVMTSKFAL